MDLYKNIFEIELLKALNYKEEDSGYDHIKYFSKNNITYVLSTNTDNISVYRNNHTNCHFISKSNFYEQLKKENEI